MAGPTRREQMRRYLQRREREGLTYAELAAATGERAHTLSWWAWKLRSERAVEEPAFVELEVADDCPAASSSIEIVLSSGRRLIVQPGFDEETLRRAVDALELSC